MLIGFLLTITGIAVDLFVSPNLAPFNLALISIETLLVAKEWRSVFQSKVDLLVTDAVFDPTTKLVALDDGYSMVRVGTSLFSSSPEIDALVRSTPIDLKIVFDKFQLPIAVRPFATQLISEGVRGRARVFNSRKVRLASQMDAVGLSSEAEVTIQPTTYFNSLVTNNAFFRQIRNRGGVVLLDGLDLAVSNGLLRSFDDVTLSNHIGVSTLAVTSDRRIVLQTQGVRSAVEPGRVVASGSGSLDWKDVMDTTMTLQDLLIHGAERELREECALPTDTEIQTIVVGFYRDLLRAGKPEFLCLSSIQSPFSTLGTSRRERHYVAAHSEALVRMTQSSHLSDDLRRILPDHEVVMSDALRYHITLIAHLLDVGDKDVRNAFSLD